MDLELDPASALGVEIGGTFGLEGLPILKLSSEVGVGPFKFLVGACELSSVGFGAVELERGAFELCRGGLDDCADGCELLECVGVLLLYDIDYTTR